MKIAVKKVLPGAQLPTYGSEFSAGADLYALLDGPCTIAPGETVLLHTGIAMEIPEGYGGFIYARSGLGVKKGLAPANKVGVIDSDYRGEIRVIPFELNVRNIILSKEPARPGAFSSYVSCKNSYDLARAAGQRIFKFDIWSFNWKLKNGDFTGPCRAESLLDHAKSLGMTRLMIAYSAWDTYHSIYGKKAHPILKNG